MQDNPLIPFAVGFKSVNEIARSDSVVPKYLLNFSEEKELLSARRDFAFFTPAALYLKAFVSEAPLADFAAGFPDRKIFHFCRFSRELFSGLECGSDTDWNRVLWAMPWDIWRDFEKFVATMVIGVPETEEVFCCGLRLQHIPIAGDALPVSLLEPYGSRTSYIFRIDRFGNSKLIQTVPYPKATAAAAMMYKMGRPITQPI